MLKVESAIDLFDPSKVGNILFSHHSRRALIADNEETLRKT